MSKPELSIETSITPFNYFSVEVGIDYLSNSQIGAWIKCPARASALMKGEWNFERSDEMLAGSYVDVALTNPSGMDKFVADNPQIISSRGPTAGQIKAKFRPAMAAIEKIKGMPQAFDLLQGPGVEQQVILTGKIDGMKFRGMLDAINVDEGLIVDLKCMANFDDKWNGSSRVPWYQYWGYWRQATIYRELARQTYGKEFDFSLLAVTKQTPPDLQYIKLKGDGAYKIEKIALESILKEIKHYRDFKDPGDLPRCLSCDYCRFTKGFDIRTGEYV
tara:strand:+ start:1129 stop:1953 length:825 start_codon:yes stop_codon:yes gene_type:complete